MRFIATKPPVIAADGMPEILTHRDWRDHPVIGFGVRGPRMATLTTKRWASPHEAFLDLQVMPFVKRIVPGQNGSLMTLDMRSNWSVSVDPSRSWNWRPKDVRQFLFDLAQYDLVTDELAVSFARALDRRTTGRRDALPVATRSAVMAKTGGVCVYCGVRLATKKGQPNSYHADHVLPVAKGGSDDVGNLVPSCRSCNLKKKDGTALQFIGGRHE